MTRLRLPHERTKYRTPVTREHIDKSCPCDMSDCMQYHALYDDLPTKFAQVERIRHIRATPFGFDFVFDHKITGDAYTAECVFGRKTARKVFSFDEVFLKTKKALGKTAAVEKARKAINAFVGEWWIENIRKYDPKPMSDADKKRLRNYSPADEESISPRRTKRREYTF